MIFHSSNDTPCFPCLILTSFDSTSHCLIKVN
jgi:hypothetical protein